MMEVLASGAMLEICASSNWLTSAFPLEEHPARRFYQRGLPVSVNSDDPGLMDITLSGEYRIWKDKFGFTEEELYQISERALDASFVSAKEKERVRAIYYRPFEVLKKSAEFLESRLQTDLTDPPPDGIRPNDLVAAEVKVDSKGHCEQERRCTNCRRLQELTAHEQAWLERWRARFECWWIALPPASQTQLGQCLGALSLHLGSRLDRFRGAPTPSQPGKTAAEPGCEALDQSLEPLELPSFPEIDFDFRLPPLPRLVPSWESLQALSTGALDQFSASGYDAPNGRSAPSATETSSSWAAVGAGGGAGFAAAAVLALIGGTARRIVGRPQLRGRSQKEHHTIGS
jgi:hypothetical protein